MSATGGQATVEAVAGIAALVLTGLLCLQLLAAGYSASLADGAAEAGAIAAVRGQAVDAAVRQALPGWSRSRVDVVRSGSRVNVRLRPPALFPVLSERLAVTSSAAGSAR